MKQLNVRIRPFKVQDTKALTMWGKHEDPRYWHYNFPYTKAQDLITWHQSKKKFLKRWIYAIENNGRVVGYITLKHVNWMKKSGEMGIALDPNCMEMGIGYKALCQYLVRVFRLFPIQVVWLRTSSFNHRAKRCYEKVGFEYVRSKRYLFEEQSYYKEILRKYPDFEHDSKHLYVIYDYMKIERKKFFEKYSSR